MEETGPFRAAKPELIVFENTIMRSFVVCDEAVMSGLFMIGITG
jgi:hypothetical protein